MLKSITRKALQSRKVFVGSEGPQIMDEREKEECPVCSILQLSTTPTRLETQPMVFSLSEHESKIDAIRECSARTGPLPCDLCRLITDLDYDWLGLEKTSWLAHTYFQICIPLCSSQNLTLARLPPYHCTPICAKPIHLEALARVDRKSVCLFTFWPVQP